MRVIIHKRDHPFGVRLGDLPGFQKLTNDEKILNYTVYMCACGLSHNKPFCDGSHRHTKSEADDRLFAYDANDERQEVSDQGTIGLVKTLPVEYKD